MTLALLFDAANLGLQYALLAVGVFLSFRILQIPDLTVDGSFCLGMSVATVMSVAGHPILGLLLGMLAGGLAGVVTGFLMTKAKINPLLAGIITMTGLYTVNITVLGGPNVSLISSPKAYTLLQDFCSSAFGLALDKDMARFIVSALVIALVIVLLALFFHTELGLCIRATGDNESMVRASSINADAMKVGTVALSNALVGLSGGLLAQYQGFADVSSGSGMIVIGLASVIIGELFGGRRSVTAGLVCAVVGSVVYRVIIQVALSLDILSANSLKLVSAVIVAIFLAAPAFAAYVRQVKQRHARRRRAQAASTALTGGSTESDAAAAADGSHADGADSSVMMSATDVRKTFSRGTALEHEVLRGVDLTLRRGEFACMIGSNGAGKSTLLNAIAGEFLTDEGTIVIGGRDVTFEPDYRRAKLVSRVFQDPMRGTAPDLTVAENVALAYMRSRGKGHANLRFAMGRSNRAFIRDQLARLGFGLEDRLDDKVGLLSGGQRQAVSLLMCTIGTPDLLLLDEHTAALDPLAARRVMELTEQIVRERDIATIMVTHNVAQALSVGDRTLVMNEGAIVADVDSAARASMSVEDLLRLYRENTGEDLASDEVLLEAHGVTDAGASDASDADARDAGDGTNAR
jgi:ABC-type uncharacterized transport system ATPase component/ABC-type uncharacterized transport system permease subunit